MRNTLEMTTEELLYELGYDDRENNLYGNEQAMTSFMKETRMEQLREAQSYTYFLEDTTDDSYIEMKNCEFNDDLEECDDEWESIDSVADGLGFYIDDDNHWIPKD
jgi:hypothetical protein